MAKGSAKEGDLGKLHSLLAKVFARTLEKYMLNMETLDRLSEADKLDFEDEFVKELLEVQEPNPAMLSAVSKFLKDNDIGFDSEEIDELSSMERRLADKRETRKRAGLSLADIPVVGNG